MLYIYILCHEIKDELAVLKQEILQPDDTSTANNTNKTEHMQTHDIYYAS